MLDVGVIGAGIAGFSAAIGLSKAGHRVEIFERSRFTNEIGAAIISAPNGSRILSSWEFDFDKAGAVDCRRMTRIRADTLEIDSEDHFGGIEDTYGERWCFFHRSDLHAGLHALSRVQTPEIKTRLGATVEDIDIEAGSIRLVDGTVTLKDLIIVADGCRSQFIDKFIGRKYPVVKAPMSVYRFMLPFQQAMEYPEVRKFFRKDITGISTFYKTEVGRPGLLMSTYPSRGGDILYLGLLHLTKPSEERLEDWTSPASVDDVLAAAGEFHPAFQAMFKDASDVKVFTSMFRTPIEHCGKGVAIMVGDAGHLMLATHAQGASQALEDAKTLEILFANVCSQEQVRQKVQAYNEFRMPRLSAVQTMSNKMMPSPAKMLEEVKTFYDGTLPGPNAKTYSKAYNDFFFRYDIAEAATRFLVIE